MNNDIFRKKSLDKIKSPDNLNDYVRVVNPGVWIIVIASIILLAGACVWGIFGKIETKISANASVSDGVAVCSVTKDEIDSVKEGMPVIIDGVEGVVSEIDKTDDEVSALIDLPDGNYPAEIITEQIKPFSFVSN